MRTEEIITAEQAQNEAKLAIQEKNKIKQQQASDEKARTAKLLERARQDGEIAAKELLTTLNSVVQQASKEGKTEVHVGIERKVVNKYFEESLPYWKMFAKCFNNVIFETVKKAGYECYCKSSSIDCEADLYWGENKKKWLQKKKDKAYWQVHCWDNWRPD